MHMNHRGFSELFDFIYINPVFPWCHGKTEFKLPFLFSVYYILYQNSNFDFYFPAGKLKNGIRNLIFVSSFPTILENGIPISISLSLFVFRFPTTLKNGIRFSIVVYRFPTTLENGIRISFSFYRHPVRFSPARRM